MKCAYCDEDFVPRADGWKGRCSNCYSEPPRIRKLKVSDLVELATEYPNETSDDYSFRKMVYCGNDGSILFILGLVTETEHPQGIGTPRYEHQLTAEGERVRRSVRRAIVSAAREILGRELV